MEDVSQHNAAVLLFFGLDRVVGQSVGHLQPVAQEEVDGKLQRQVQGVKDKIAYVLGPGELHAHQRQDQVAIADHRRRGQGGIIPPQAQIQPEQLETVALHHLLAFPEGCHGAHSGMVDDDIACHPVLVHHREGKDAEHHAEKHKRWSHGCHQLGIGSVVQDQAGIQHGSVAHQRNQQIHGGIGKRRDHVDHDGDIHAGEDDGEADQSL